MASGSALFFFYDFQCDKNGPFSCLLFRRGKIYCFFGCIYVTQLLGKLDHVDEMKCFSVVLTRKGVYLR